MINGLLSLIGAVALGPADPSRRAHDADAHAARGARRSRTRGSGRARRRSPRGHAAPLRGRRRASSGPACSCSSFLLAARDLLAMRWLARTPTRRSSRRYFSVDAGRRPADRRRVPARSAVDGDDARHHRRRRADPHLQRRLHAGRPGVPALLRVPQPVRLLHARAGARRELPGAVRRAGKASGSAPTC